MAGILPDKIIPTPWQPLANLDPNDPVSLAITELWRKRQTERDRTTLAHALGDIPELAADIERERERAWNVPKTQAIYKAELRRFYQWCAREQLSWLPSCDEYVATYLFVRADGGASPYVLTRIKAAVAWCHKLSGFAFDDTLTNAALAYCRRNWRGGTKDKPDEPAPEQPATEKELEHGVS